MQHDCTINRHYGRDDMAEAVLAAAGKAHPTVDDLSPFDEFHIGGRAATAHLAKALTFQTGQKILDVGCGIGGATRFFAQNYDLHVTGIDLTESYIEAATTLSAAVGLSNSVRFMTGNALSLPFENETFDGAYSIHTAMNIADKAKLYQEIRRVLKRGAIFGLYDILHSENPAPLDFPVPWASSTKMSFLSSIGELKSFLVDAGFEILESEDRRDFTVQALSNPILQSKNSPARLVMGDNYALKIANLRHAVSERRCTPWQVICRATGGSVTMK
jgi:ubiquinone/menaquinone biosynthesis C-methylase UbiE